MNSVIMTTAYLPPQAFFRDLVRMSVLLLEAQENYSRQTYRNRCCIYGPNGMLRLTVPVVHPAKDQKIIRDIRIDYRDDWQNIHWRSIESAYNRSPFFLYYRDGLERVFFQRSEFLFDHNLQLIQWCLKALKLDFSIQLTESYEKSFSGLEDKRDKVKAGKKGSVDPFIRYPQVFEPIHGFIPNLSIIDLIFNRGNEALNYLRNQIPE